MSELGWNDLLQSSKFLLNFSNWPLQTIKFNSWFCGSIYRCDFYGTGNTVRIVCVCGFVSVIIFQKIRLFSTSLSVISTKGALPPPFSHHNINLSFISVRRYISYGIIIIKHITLSASYDLCLAYKHCRESQFVSTRLPSGILAWHLNASTMSLDAADVTCLTWFDKSKLWVFFVFF